MKHITRSQWYLGKIGQFVKSDDPKLYIELYSSELDRITKKYPHLYLYKSNKVMATVNDKRYHVLIQKESLDKLYRQ